MMIGAPHRVQAALSTLALALGARRAAAQSAAPATVDSEPPHEAVVARDSSPATPTLQTWADDMWLQFTDRSGSAGGRFSRAGILQRFQRRMDAQYDINLLTTGHAVDEDAEWHARPNGVRIFGGSYERAQLAAHAELKVTAPLAKHLAVGVTMRSAHDLVNHHELLRVRFARELPAGFEAYAESSLQSVKSDMDGTLGGRWRRRGAEVGADVTFLDFPNNIVSSNRDLLRDLLYDSSYTYVRHPVALRTTVRTPIGRAAWVEMQTAAVQPGRVTIASLTDGGGASLGDRGGYQAVLLGSRVGRRAQLGAFATRVRARSDRVPTTPGGSVLDDFVLVEETRQIGALATLSAAPRVHVSAWTALTERVEARDYRRAGPAGGANPADVDYADRAFDARVVARYGAPAGGLQLIVDGAFDDRRNLRGLGQVPGRQPVPHYSLARTALMAGWRGPSHTEIVLGTRLEYDVDTPGGTGGRRLSVAGFQGRGTMYW
jgi:hypothetical protein